MTLLRACSVVLTLSLSLAATPAAAQQPAPQADPRDFGLVLPVDAEVRPGEGRRVLVKDLSEKLVVGRVHVEVGDRLVVMLPDGRLISVPQREATSTDRPFVAATKEAIQADLTRETFKGFKTRATKHYVYVYNTSEPFYKATSQILETMYPNLLAYCKRLKLDVAEPEVPLVVIMFRTQEEFDKYRDMPEGVAAYYNGVTNHVVMYEQSRLAEVAPDLAVRQAISTIAHEGVHQILHNIGVQQRLSRWPMWISEGLPEYFAPTDVGKRVRWKGVGLVNDLRMYTLEKQLQQRAGIATGELVRETVRAEELSSEGYAAAWALVHYLARYHQEPFVGLVREASELGPLDEPPDAEELFTRHFGSDFADHESRLIKHLQKLPYADPVANQTHYVGMLTTALRKSVIVTTSPASIQEWQKELGAQLPPAERSRAQLRVQAFPNKAAAEQFASAWLARE